MLIYFGLLVAVVILAHVAQRVGVDRWPGRHFIAAQLCLLVLVAGLRMDSVGTDTRQYVLAFEQGRTLEGLLSDSALEPGYLLLSAAAHAVSNDYAALLTAIALASVSFHLWSIYKHSKDPPLSIFVYLTMGYYTFVFNGARQAIACAIYTMSLHALTRGNFRQYCFWICLALLFHRSVIIALPAYFLFRQPTTIRYLLQMALATALIIRFMDLVLDAGASYSDKYAVYQISYGTGGQYLTLFYVALSALFFYLRRIVQPAERCAYDCLLNMIMFGAAIYVAVAFSGANLEITRAAYYFQVATIFIWPVALRSISDRKGRQLVLVSFAAGSLVYYFIFLEKMANLTPYRFNEAVLQF